MKAGMMKSIVDRARTPERHPFTYRGRVRGGFTLIEMLIVMVIILVLAGLLLGAVLVVRGRVVVGQQVAEITQLNLALEKFKQTYGTYPPSRIRLREFVAGNAANTVYDTNNAFDRHSISYLQRIFPSIVLPTSSNAAELTASKVRIDWFVDNSAPNLNVNPEVFELEGDECLVFFLGGIAERTESTYIMHGFTDDPTNPSRIPNPGDTTDASAPRTTTRRAPLFNFDGARLFQRRNFSGLVDDTRTGELAAMEFGEFYSGSVPSGRVGNLPSYRALGSDPGRPMPVVYFSSYEGRGYRPDDCNIPASENVPAGDAQVYFQLSWPQLTQKTTVSADVTKQIRPTGLSMGPNPYTRTTANPDLRLNTAGNVTPIQPYNPTGFQIIVPGPDGEFGGGGAQADYVGTGGLPAGWSYNEDNITNFTDGKTVGEFRAQQSSK
jgi:general secretion pathway protein G